MKTYIVGITGATGSIYGKKVVEGLVGLENKVYLVMTTYGKKVFEYELQIDFTEWIKELKKEHAIEVVDIDDMFSPIASGSFEVEGMVIVPCSMGTLAKISSGVTDNLLIRAADVMLKEKRNLVIVPRETPLNTIHLKNMLSLSELGTRIVPPMPAFYQHPKTLHDIVDSSVGRVLKSLGIDNDFYEQWTGKKNNR